MRGMTLRVRAVALAVVLLATPTWSAQKWALLIGVNDYTKGPAHWDLRGCENDVLMTRSLLVDKFGFPEGNVRTLLSAEATAQAIRSSIEEWLIAQAQPEDIVYFHFSGHGSQTRDQEGEEEDGKDELICPTDMEIGNLQSVITDDQLRELFGRVQARNVTIILDACHSGTGTRDLSLSYPRFAEFDPTLSEGGAGTRAVVMTAATAKPASGAGSVPSTGPSAASPAATAPPASPPAGTAPAGAAAPASAPPASVTPSRPGTGHKIAGSGGVEAGGKLQVTISGCRPDQTSADAMIRDGFYAGALTYHLVENMKRAPPNITYRELMERVVRDVKAKKFTQLPQVEGAIDRPLLGVPVAEAPSVPFLVVHTVSGSNVQLSGGRAQGVTEGSVYAVYGPSESRFSGPGLGRLRVTSVQDMTATARAFDGVSVTPGMRAKEVLHKAESEPLKLVVEGDASMVAAITQALGAVDYVSVVGGQGHFDHRLKVDAVGGIIQAALTIDGVPGPAVSAADAEGLLAALGPQLENAYTVKFLSDLQNASAAFGVEVWANVSRPGTRDLVVEALDGAPDEKLVYARVGDVIRLNVRADRDCYLTLINVGTSGKVTVLFPNQYRRDGFIRGGRVYRTETRGEMPFKIRATGPAGRELVKVIATREPLDLSSIRLGEAGGLGTRTIASGSAFAAALTRDLAVEGMAGEGTDLALLPTDGWATDYLLIETTP
jgi:hypothetical protein